MSEEHILVIKRSRFDELGAFQGFSSEVERYLPSLVDPSENFFIPRAPAELDPSHKQIIPYAIFQHGDTYLIYQRGGKSGEKRLVAKQSLGIGGHINPVDTSLSGLGEETYFNGVAREIHEELQIVGGYQQEVLGLINDDANEVGQVHLGVVHLFKLETNQVTSNEDAIQNLRFLTLQELEAESESLESWSQIILEHLKTLA